MMKKIPFDVDALKNWFVTARRDLPWRKTTDPYAIWVSEIMLQQTQVAVVKEYYLQWMARFPTISSLAAAPVEEAIKMWEGLGYYSRVRHLHEAAQFLLDHYGGTMPSSKIELAQVKGLGPYTIGAILSFAFHKKAAAVDGNTVRVLCRYFGIADDVQKSGTQKKIWEIAEEILPENEPWLVVEGLIELGATICKRDPICILCPLQEKCIAHRQNMQTTLPKKGKKVEITALERQVFVITHNEKLLVKKGESGKVMADLYEFPYLDAAKEKNFPFSFPAVKLKTLPVVEHSFTRFRVKLFPAVWQAAELVDVPQHEWIMRHEIQRHPFSSGHRKILNLL
jgi:A/G-specific adenine glycosylase